MNKKMDNYKVFGLTRSIKLTKEICKVLNVPFNRMNTTHFNDGEILSKPNISIRGKNVILVQSTDAPTNDSLMELLIAIDACKNASARSILVLIPYFGYARQDRKSAPREPISSKLVAHLLSTAGATRVVTVDIHSHPTLGYFDIPVDDISLVYLFCGYIANVMTKHYPNDRLAVVSPDYGGVIRVRQSAKILESLNAGVAILDKRRPKPNASEILNILGDIKDKVCFIIDDMIDTGGTICKSAEVLKKNGAKVVYILATHGVLSGKACTNLEAAITANYIKGVVITDTIYQGSSKTEMPGLEVISTAPHLAYFIQRICNNESLGAVYQNFSIELKNELESK